MFQKIGIPLIISVLGHTDEEFEILIQKFNAVDGICAMELIYPALISTRKPWWRRILKATHRLITQLKRIARYPLIAKLTPNVMDIAQIALAAPEVGADAISLINIFTAMEIDINHRGSVLGNFTGGLISPAIRPIAVSMVHQVARQVKIPVMGMGGIRTA